MVGLVYALLSYGLFFGVFSYLVGFSDALVVPKTVDSSAAWGFGPALGLDLALLVLFGLQHSIMARRSFKQKLTRFIPVHLERATFVLATSVALVALMGLWQGMPRVLFEVESPLARDVLWSVNALGWAGVGYTSFLINHFELFGLEQAWNAFRGRPKRTRGFVLPLAYRYVRHPMMTAFLIGFWVTPRMTLGHFVLALGMSAYIVVGVHFEEHALVAELGEEYARYRASTPKFFPLPRRRAAG
jgi:protein-S-isoprenylcysteine O-methyltransferase Ste14